MAWTDRKPVLTHDDAMAFCRHWDIETYINRATWNEEINALACRCALELLGYYAVMKYDNGYFVVTWAPKTITISGESGIISPQAPGEQTNQNQNTKGNSMLYSVAIYTKPTIEAAQSGELEKLLVPPTPVTATNPNAAVAKATLAAAEAIGRNDLSNAVVVVAQLG